MIFKLEPLQEKSVFFNNQRKPVTRSDREKGEYPYYGAAGIQDYVSEFIFDGRYILVGEDGTVISNNEYPVVQIAEGKFWVNNHAHVIRPTSEEDFDFLYYVLVGSKVKNLVTGAVQPKLSMTNLKSLLIPWPENAEVRRGIGKTLSILDKKIQANDALTETLESMAQGIFRSWFVDFDPVKAKIAGDKPSGMDASIAALFPDSIEICESGEIPSGWENSTVEKFCPFVYGKPLPAGSRVAGDVPVYGSNGIVGSHNAPLVRRPTVVIGRKGTVGTVHIEMSPSWIIDTAFYTNTGNDDDVFLAYLSLKGLGLDSMNSDAAVPGLNRDNAHRLTLTIATSSIREAFSQLVKPLFELNHQLMIQNSVLRQVRDSIMPRIISGELSIPKEMLAR